MNEIKNKFGDILREGGAATLRSTDKTVTILEIKAHDIVVKDFDGVIWETYADNLENGWI
jgi:hypothetical protein